MKHNRTFKTFGALFSSLLVLTQATFAARIGDDSVTIGKQGSTANKTVKMGAGRLLWNESEQKLKFSNDGGSSVKNIGAGAGGAGGINLLSDNNPDFESALSGSWTASAGSLTAETGAPLFGSQSANFDASASGQNVDSVLKTIPVGLQSGQCSAQIWYKYPSGAGGDYKLQALDNSSNVLSEASLDLAAIARLAFVVFPCPASGSVRLRITSTANASAIVFDEAHLGSNTREVQVASAAFAGSSYFDTTSTCYWFRTNTALGAFSTTSACPGPTIDAQKIGTWSTTDTDLPKQTIDLPPGLYRITVSLPIRASTGGAEVALALSDGTNTRGRVSYIDQGGGAHVPVVISAWFEYSSAGSRTFEIFGASNTGQIELNLGQSLRRLVFHVERYPLASESAISFDKTDWLVDVNIGGANVSIPGAAQTSYSELTNSGLDMVLRSGSNSAEIPCSATNPSTGLTCSVGDESLGASFVVPSAGKYKACASFSHAVAGDFSDTFQLVETENNSQTILQEGGDRQNSGTNITGNTIWKALRVCGIFSFSSAGKKTIRLMYEKRFTSQTTDSIATDRVSVEGQRDLRIEIYPISKVQQGITFANMVSTTQETGDRMGRVRVGATCSGSPCTITSQSGSWVSSITRAGVGDYALNIASGIFSATPTCNITSVYGQTDFAHCSWREGGTQSATVRTFDCGDAGDVARDTGFEIVCMGPK